MSHDDLRIHNEPSQTTTAADTMAPATPQGPGLFSSPLVQRKIQRRTIQRRGAGAATEGTQLQQAADQGISGASSTLPHSDTIQKSFGRHDVSGIQAHTDDRASSAAQGMGAEAFATGNHVAFAGAPSLHTAAHEAAHVVQQKAGVSLQGGVGKEGDSYERHADAVADAVVSGRSAEALLDAHAGGGGGGGGVQHKAVQRKDDNAKSGNVEQVHVNKDGGKAAKDPTVNAGSVNDPFGHPYWPAFRSRIGTLFGKIAQPEGVEPEVMARSLWSGAMAGMGGSQEGLKDQSAYTDFNAGYLDMGSKAFKDILSSFEGMMGKLEEFSSSQFSAAKSYGFWSTGSGKALAESVCDITLETSAIGALFDGIPSLDGQNKIGWDVHLWGALSKAYGNAVGKQLKVKGKKAHVCVGPNARSGNIFEMIESIAIKKHIEPFAIDFKEVTRFHAAAPKPTNEYELDASVHQGDYKGCAWSGQDLVQARDEANKYWSKVKQPAGGKP